MTIAYSYLRFSTPEQAKGDSIRRQTQARDAWLASHPDVKLDTSLKMTDAGRSAFQRTDPETYALAQFVELVKSGRVKPGSYLLVENLDRLSREEAGEAVELFLSIVNRGVVIVQLMPTVLEFRKPVNTMSLMFAIVELSRGHSESAAKSNRGREVWARKQREASPTKIVTTKLPAWIVESDGRLVLDEKRAATVRRLFKMCSEGMGSYTIAKALNEDDVPVLGREVVKGARVRWADATVRCILTSRAAIGEYIPYNRRNKSSKPQAKPVPNYFPAVVDEATFQKAQRAIATRAVVGRGRKGKTVNLFAGLLHDAKGTGTMTYRQSPKAPPSIVPMASLQGRGAKWVRFPVEQFDVALLSRLRELKASDLEDGNDANKKVEILEGRLRDVDALIGVWKAKMNNIAIADLVEEKLGELNTDRKQVATDLEAAKREAASPLSDSLDELNTLAGVLARDNSDETRLKVRAVIRRIVTGVWVLLVRSGKTRFAAVRVMFGTEKARDYLISYTDSPKPGNGKPKLPGRLTAYTFRQKANLSVMDYATGEDRTVFMGLDLRDEHDAAEVEKVLAGWDTSKPLSDLIDDKRTPRGVARWLANLEGGNELVGIAPSLPG
jgi:DNA invertase Pin-like site-specific DNA recombinase